MAGRRQDSPLVVGALLVGFWLVPALLMSLLAFVLIPQSGSLTEMPAADEMGLTPRSELGQGDEIPPVSDLVFPSMGQPPESESAPPTVVTAPRREDVSLAEGGTPLPRGPDDTWRKSLLARQLRGAGSTAVPVLPPRASTQAGECGPDVVQQSRMDEEPLSPGARVASGGAHVPPPPPGLTASRWIPKPEEPSPEPSRPGDEEASIDPATETPESAGAALSKVTPPVPPDETDRGSFSLHRIGRSEFPLARPLEDRRHKRAIALGRSNVRGNAEGARPAEFSLWDELQIQLFGTISRPVEGVAARQSQSHISLTRILSAGRLHLQAHMVDREGRLFLAQRSLGLETFGRWRFAAGDQAVPPGAAGMNGTQARILLVERRGAGGASSPTWKAGGLWGRVPLSHFNIESGVFPRNLAAVYGRVQRPGRYHLHGLLYTLSDRDVSGAGSGVGVRDGVGASLSGSLRNTRFNLLGQLHGTDLNLDQRDDGTALAASFSGGGEVGPLGLGMRVQGTRGPSYEMDYHGALQSTPGLIQEGNLSLRARAGLSVSAWAGRWANPVVSQNTGGRLELRQVSASGDQAGARMTWRIGKTGTALALSRENRSRERDAETQRVVSTGASVSQNLRGRVGLSIRWNRIHYSDRGAHDHLTGNLSFRLGRRVLVSVQQRTLWQEPYGPRLESILDVSGVRILDDRFSLSAQLAVTQDRWASEEFRQSQVQSQFHVDYRLSQRFRLTSRYRMNHSDFGEVHSFHLAVVHSPNPRHSELPRATDPVLLDRQLLKGDVFEDLNGDGRRQEGEPGIPGVEVAVDENARQPLVTDTEGTFRGIVLLGRHTLRLVPASVPTEYLLRGVGPVEVEVMYDRPAQCAFPLARRVGSIRGYVVDDTRGGGLADVKVLLGERDFTFTDKRGFFRFTALPAGEYDLSLDPRTLPFGYGPEQEITRVHIGDEVSSETPLILHTSRPLRRLEF